MNYQDEKVSASLQDYLEVILSLSKEGEGVRVTDIAAELNIAKASVTQALSVLKKQGLAWQDRYGPVNLTEEGKKHALSVYKRHQIIRFFLTEILKVEPETAEKDACSLEHIVSPQTLKKIQDFLDEQGVPYNQHDNDH